MAKTLTAGKAAGARTKQDKRAYAQLGHNTWRKAFMQHYWLYILMIPGILYMLIFNYTPMAGLVMAFEDFSPYNGDTAIQALFGSPFAGLKYFEKLFTGPDFWRLLRNTLAISLANLIFAFPAPIILALLPSISVREALLISAPLAALGIGLPLSSSYLVIQRTFYAFEDGKHPFIFMAITMAIQGGVIIASTFILPPTQWITVIGLAISVSFILPYPLLTHMLRSRFDGDVDDKRIITAYAKALVATIAACVIGLLCRNGVYRLVGAHIGPDDGTMNWGQAVLSAILLTIVIAIVYLACLWALRAEELTSVVGMLAARIPGLGNKPKSGGTASPNGKLEQSTAENGDQE